MLRLDLKFVNGTGKARFDQLERNATQLVKYLVFSYIDFVHHSIKAHIPSELKFLRNNLILLGLGRRSKESIPLGSRHIILQQSPNKVE